MLIYVRTDGQTDRQTDKSKIEFGTSQKKNVFHRTDGQTHVQLKTEVQNLTK